jgi:hypothetical protein
MTLEREPWRVGVAVPKNDREAWESCVQSLLPKIGIVRRNGDLAERKRHARLLAIAALRAAGENPMADSLERDA